MNAVKNPCLSSKWAVIYKVKACEGTVIEGKPWMPPHKILDQWCKFYIDKKRGETWDYFRGREGMYSYQDSECYYFSFLEETDAVLIKLKYSDLFEFENIEYNE